MSVISEQTAREYIADYKSLVATRKETGRSINGEPYGRISLTTKEVESLIRLAEWALKHRA